LEDLKYRENGKKIHNFLKNSFLENDKLMHVIIVFFILKIL